MHIVLPPGTTIKLPLEDKIFKNPQTSNWTIKTFNGFKVGRNGFLTLDVDIYLFYHIHKNLLTDQV